ncbi:MAG: ABC transporter permease [Solirubrobacteraceae bacterium]
MNIKLFITLRYLIAKKNKNIVNVITLIAILAIGIATSSTFVILSTFSGLEKYNLKFQNSLSPEIEISSKKGKKLLNINLLEKIIKNQQEVYVFSKTITEKVYVSCGDKNEVLNLKAVDYNFNEIYRIDSLMVLGSYLDFSNTNNSILGTGAANNLFLLSGVLKPVKLFVPKPGINLITNEDDAFNKAELYINGIVGQNSLYENSIFTPLSVGQKILGMGNNEAYNLEIKLNAKESAENFKKKLSGLISTNLYSIKTRLDQNEAFVKVMNTEKLIIYFIFSLILFITIFNLSGAIIILILDKKEHIFILSSLGLPINEIRKIFFYVGLAITFAGVLFGLGLGTFISIIQKEFSLVMANAYTPFPIEFVWQNYFYISLIVISLGTFTSFFVSKIIFRSNLKSVNSY